MKGTYMQNDPERPDGGGENIEGAAGPDNAEE
jgi:hypothetical protein